MGSRGKAFFRDLCSCGLNLLVWPRSCWGICPSASLVPDCSTFSAKKETNTGSGPERLADDFLAIQGFGNVCIEMAWHRDTRVLQLNRKVWSLQPLAGIQRDEQFVVLAPTPWCACVWLCVHSLVNWNPMHSGLVWVFPCNLTAGFAGRFNFLYVPLCFREKNSLCFLEDKWTLPWPRTIFTISFTLGDCVVIEPPWPVFGTRCRGHSHDQSFCWMRSEGRRVLVLLWVSGGWRCVCSTFLFVSGRRNTSEDEFQFSWQAQAALETCRAACFLRIALSRLRQVLTRCKLRGRPGILWHMMKIDGIFCSYNLWKFEEVSYEMLVLSLLHVSSRFWGFLVVSLCLWGKLQNLSFLRVPKEVMSFCVAGTWHFVTFRRVS